MIRTRGEGGGSDSRLQAPHLLPASRVKESLKEAADVHWLNSLEDGNACLLVDCYRDLSDGAALEEAFLLIEGLFAPSASSTRPIDRLRRVLASVEESRGRSAMPPRLLQPDFPQQVCRGDPSACGQIVGFLRKLHELNHARANAGKGRVVKSCSESLHTAEHGKRGPRTHNSRRGNDDKGNLDTSCVRPIDDPHFGRDGTTGGDHKSSCARNDTSQTSMMQRVSPSHHLLPTRLTPPPPPLPLPRSQSSVAQAPQRKRPAKVKERLASNAGKGNARAVGTATRNAFRRNPTSEAAVTHVLATAVAGAGSSVAGTPRNVPTTGPAAHVLATAVAGAGSSVAGTPRNVPTTGPAASRHRAAVVSKPEWDASTICERGLRSAGRLAHEGRESAVVAAARAGHGTTGLSTEYCEPGERTRRADEIAEAAEPSRAAGRVSAAGSGQKRADRREILRWMGRLRVKVGWALLRPEGAPCHDRFSSGELLCELAAALDYAVSGGRGLPLSEIPSCPGRFVLSGTCSGPAGKNNAARSRHNVRTALAAFDALGGVRGVWLRSEEAILVGDHEATWGLLRDLYTRYGRIRSTGLVRTRPQQPPRRPGAPPDSHEELHQQQQQQQQRKRGPSIIQQHQQQQRVCPTSQTPIASGRSKPASPCPVEQCRDSASSTPLHGKGSAGAIPPPTTQPTPTTVTTSRAIRRATSQASTPAVRPRGPPCMQATNPQPNESDPTPTGTRVAHRSRVLETVCLGPRGTEKVPWVDPSSTPLGCLPKGADHGEDGGPERKLNGRLGVRRARGGGGTAGVEVTPPSQQRNGGAFRGRIEEEQEADSSLVLQTGARHSVSMPLFESNDDDSATTPAKETHEQSMRGLDRSGSEVPHLSEDDPKQFDGMGQIFGSENTVFPSKPPKVADASKLLSPSRAGERASAETARWLRWNPGFGESSLVGTTAQDRGQSPICPEKVVGKGRGTGELFTCALNSKDCATAAVDAAVIPPSSKTTDGCEVFLPLRVAAMSPPHHADIPVGVSTPVRGNVWSSFGITTACNEHSSGRQPRLSPVEELSVVDSPLTKTESGTRHPGAACGKRVKDNGANAEPLADSVASRDFHELPSAENSASNPSNKHNDRRAGGNGVTQLPLAGVTSLGDDAMTRGMCMRLVVSSDPFARGSNSDLLPVAHLHDVKLCT